MGCIHSTEAPAASSKKKKKGAGTDSSKKNGKTGKKGTVKTKTVLGKTPQAASKKGISAAQKPKAAVVAAAGAAATDQRPSAKATNPLDFTTNGSTQVAGSQRDRLSSISTTESARDIPLTAHPSTADMKNAAVDHIPLSDGKLKNLRIWIDATDKVQLLDPQDTIGQQRRERERAAGAPPQQSPLVIRKRASILNAFTDITCSPSECEPNGSVRALRDETASALSSNM